MTHRPLRAVAAALFVVAVAAGCAPQAATVQPSGTGGPVNTDAASLGDVTISFLDFSAGADEIYMEKAISMFEEEYPNITIKRTAAGYEQVMATLNLRLAEKDGPDVATINNGWQSMGTLSKGGLLLNLDPYAKAYGWLDQMPATIRKQLEFTTDGKTMGSGSLWGAPGARLTAAGLYYNTEKLKALGLQPPTTVAELEEALAAAKQAGEVPIQQGMQSKTSAPGPLFVLQTFFGSAQSINDFVYHSGGVSLADTGMLKAAETIADWSKKGWFNHDTLGIDYESGRDAFHKGTGVFHFDYVGSMAEEGVDGSRFARLGLPQDGQGATTAVAASSAVLGIAARTPHPDAAAAFVNFLGSIDANQLSVDSGMLPIRNEGTTVPSTATQVFISEFEQGQQVAQHDGFVPFLDWASPNMLEIVGGQVQLILAGSSTPEQLVEAAQKDYDTFFAGK